MAPVRDVFLLYLKCHYSFLSKVSPVDFFRPDFCSEWDIVFRDGRYFRNDGGGNFHLRGGEQ